MRVRFSHIDPKRKIQAIKAHRTLTDIGLKEAKAYCDAMGPLGDIPGEEFEPTPGWQNFDEAFEYCLDHFVRLERVSRFDGPLSIDKLALKLALHGFSIPQVEALADALEGIEDAEGSLRAAAKAMEAVA